MPTCDSRQIVRSDGAGPFVSRIVYSLADGALETWTSRRHRKGIGQRQRASAAEPVREQRRSLWRGLWSPDRIGWWIAILFMVGSAGFALASFIALDPDSFSPRFQSSIFINATFFAGSVFFTSAGYVQLLEAVNADRRAALDRGEESQQPFRWFAWQAGQIGWLAAFIQLIGTLLFNLNTLDALLPGAGWLRQDVLVWTPDMVGSVCFLVASWLAIMEVCHEYWSWQVHDLSWWVVMINLLGSAAFMVSALSAVVVPGSEAVLAPWVANVTTFIGAVCFLVGAYLLLPELALE